MLELQVMATTNAINTILKLTKLITNYQRSTLSQNKFTNLATII